MFVSETVPLGTENGGQFVDCMEVQVSGRHQVKIREQERVVYVIL